MTKHDWLYKSIQLYTFNEFIAYQWEAGIADKMWADKDTLRKYATDEYIGGILYNLSKYQNLWSYIDSGGI